MEDLIKEMEDLQSRAFMVNMADHLSTDDYRFLDECHTRVLAIKQELKDKYGWEEK